MSWIRVVCSNGSRYAAPSFAPPPTLEGFDRLFTSADVALRGIQCFPIARTEHGEGSGGAADGVSNTDRVSVMFGQFELGGRLGLATAAVGTTSSGGGAADCDAYLAQLLTYTEDVLRSTSEAGVKAMLDAVCTQPLSLHEECGGADMGDGEVREYNGLPTRATRAERRNKDRGLKNRSFLRNVQPGIRSGEEAVGDDDDNGATPSSLSPMTSTSVSPSASFTDRQRQHSANAAGFDAVVPCPLSFADSVRRQAYLHFTTLHAVPLSLLFSRTSASWVVVGADGKRLKGKDGGASSSRNAQRGSRGDSGNDDRNGGSKRASRKNGAATAPAEGPSGLPLGATVVYISRADSCLTNVELGRSGTSYGEYWKAFVPAVSDCASAVQRAMQAMLKAAFPPGFEEVFEYAMWTEEPARSPVPGGMSSRTSLFAATPAPPSAQRQGPSSPDIIAAAFSPSGLLLSSPSFQRCLSHTERFKLSAVAIDAMTRGGGGGGATTPATAAAAAASLLQVKQFPLLVTPPSAPSAAGPVRSVVVDVCLLTVGDSMSYAFGFPRPAAGTAPSAAETTLTVDYLLNYFAAAREALSRLAQSLPSSSSSPAAEGDAISVVHGALEVCTTATRPHMPSFFHSLFRTISPTLEEYLAIVAQERQEQKEEHQRGPPPPTPQHGGGKVTVNSTVQAGVSVPTTTATATATPRYPPHAYLPQERQGKAQSSATPATGHGAPDEATAQRARPLLEREKEEPQQQQQQQLAKLPGNEAVPTRTNRFLCALPFLCRRSKGKKGKAGGMAPAATPSAELRFPTPPSTGANEERQPEHAGVEERSERQWGVPASQQWHAQASERVEQNELRHLRQSLAPLEEAVLTWCYIAATVTQLELSSFRPVERLGVHSFFSLASDAAVLAKAEAPSSQPRTGGAAGMRPSTYLLSFFRPQLQDRGADRASGGDSVPGEIIHDATQLCALLGNPAAASALPMSSTMTTLMPSYALEVVGPEPRQGNGTGGDDESSSTTSSSEGCGEEGGEAGESSVLCVLQTSTRQAHRTVVAGGGKSIRHQQQRHVLVSLEGYPATQQLDLAPALQRLLEKQSTADVGLAGDVFSGETKEEMKLLCKALESCLRATSAVLDNAFVPAAAS